MAEMTYSFNMDSSAVPIADLVDDIDIDDEEADGASAGNEASAAPQREPIENLVLRGGGVKGLAYCGALRILHENKLLGNLKRFAGSSAGAITACLLAIGYSISEMEPIFRNSDMTAFKDSSSLLAKAERLIQSYALYEGKYFYNWLSGLIAAKANENITFQQVFTQFGKELVVTGTCISHMEVHYFSRLVSPDMPIRDAVRISMSIPIMFEPVKVDDHVFVDGGLADNFPLHVFDSEVPDDARWAGPNMRTLGLFLQEDKTRDRVTRDIKGMKEFVGCLVDTIKMRITQLSIKPGDENRTLFISTHHVTSTNFNITDEEKDLLIHEGERAGRKYCGNSSDSAATATAPAAAGKLVVHLKEGFEFKRHNLPCTVHCLLSVGPISKKSSRRFLSSNPVWNENFVFPVMSANEFLKVEVFNSMSRKPRVIGSSALKISDLPDHTPMEFSLVLEGQGKVALKITYSASN